MRDRSIHPLRHWYQFTDTTSSGFTATVLAREGAEVGVSTLRSLNQLSVATDTMVQSGVFSFQFEGFARTGSDAGIVPRPSALTPVELARKANEIDHAAAVAFTMQLVRQWRPTIASAVSAGRTPGTVEKIGKGQERRNMGGLLDITQQDGVVK